MSKRSARPKVFICYAHRGNQGFAPRLAAALELVGIDVFWDQKLQLGSWEPQLMQAIHDCDYFAIVMSQPQADSESCKHELTTAHEVRKEIAPLKIHEAYSDPSLSALQYCDFSEDFEVGFRALTCKILNQPLSSWEYLAYERDEGIVLQSLADGRVPGLIAKTVGDWVIVERLWAYVNSELVQRYGYDGILFGAPRTAQGILEQIPHVSRQLAEHFDQSKLLLLKNTEELIRAYVKALPHGDTNHAAIGAAVTRLIEDTGKLFLAQTAAYFDALGVADLQNHYRFNLSEKIRELVALYARRSRYLY